MSVRYAAAKRRGGRLLGEAPDCDPERPIALLATAIPCATTLSIAIHLLHVLSLGVGDKFGPGEELGSAGRGLAPPQR